MAFVEELNPQQQQAVTYRDGPMLVLAGAGSGKTRIVTSRIVQLLKSGIDPEVILAVTFTNKAAGEMRQRIERHTQKRVLATTFHSLGARILRKSIGALGYRSDFLIFDEDDSEKVLKECIEELMLGKEKAFLKSASALISEAKNSCSTIRETFLAPLYQLYQKKLKGYNAVDFDDLLFLSATLLKEFPEWLSHYQNRWQYILIDEYQDTNIAQCDLIKLIAGNKGNLFAVGDPDQSIYSWRGANIDNILNFERDFPGAVILPLEQNYRSRNNILQAATALIEHNQSRYQKRLWSDRGDGNKIGLYIGFNERDESDFAVEQIRRHHQREKIPYHECAIFYRTHFQSRPLEDRLLRKGMPYTIVGGISFYQRREIKDIVAFLRMVQGSGDYHSFARTINIPKRGWGEVAIAKLRTLSQERGDGLFTTCLRISSGECDIKISAKQKRGLAEYVDSVVALRKMASANAPLDLLVKEAIALFGYDEYLREDPLTYRERQENLAELISKAAEWQRDVEMPTLTAFLEELSLMSSADERGADGVRLMTLHHSKGLEFSVVTIVGMEEELFPHAKAKESNEEMEEERRLCYVGMTRAKEQLYLVSCRERILWGRKLAMQPSRFLAEIPEQYLEIYRPIEKRSASWGGGESEPFEPGDSVIHHTFGRGVVNEVHSSSLGLTYEVFFPKEQRACTLVAKYARLRRAQ